MPRTRPFLAALLAAAGLGTTATPAGAALVYVRDADAAKRPATVWIAADDGSGARKLGEGTFPQISADAKTVLHFDADGSDLFVASAQGGARRALIEGAGDIESPRFSPDGSLVAAIVDRQLRVYETATGRMGVVARGDIDQLSFSPDGQRIAYSAERSGGSDVFTVSVLGGDADRLTDGGRSLLPVWGPSRIAFVRRKSSGAFDIWTMTAEGRRVRRVTATRVPSGASGLAPVEWSADGRRLAAQYVATEARIGFTVNPFTGKTRALRRKVTFDLSGDGADVLTHSGGAEPEGRHNVYAAPYGGGKSRLLVRGGAFPDWSR